MRSWFRIRAFQKNSATPSNSADSGPAARASPDDGPASSGCPTGQRSCKGVCLDETRDPANCGGCGTTCAAPTSATPVCIDGACDFVCAHGSERCGAACVDSSEATRRTAGACGSVCTRERQRAGNVHARQVRDDVQRRFHGLWRLLRGHAKRPEPLRRLSNDLYERKGVRGVGVLRFVSRATQ